MPEPRAPRRSSQRQPRRSIRSARARSNELNEAVGSACDCGPVDHVTFAGGVGVELGGTPVDGVGSVLELVLELSGAASASVSTARSPGVEPSVPFVAAIAADDDPAAHTCAAVSTAGGGSAGRGSASAI